MSSNDELNSNGRSLQDLLDAADSVTPSRSAAENEWTDGTGEDDDVYDPTTEESEDGLHEFFEQLIEEEEDDDEEEEDEDEEYHGWLF
jgi:hypothetical protein